MQSDSGDCFVLLPSTRCLVCADRRAAGRYLAWPENHYLRSRKLEPLDRDPPSLVLRPDFRRSGCLEGQASQPVHYHLLRASPHSFFESTPADEAHPDIKDSSIQLLKRPDGVFLDTSASILFATPRD